MSNVYLLEAKMEFLKSLRMKAYSLSTVLFPAMFYIFFGLSMGRQQSPDAVPMARYQSPPLAAIGSVGSHAGEGQGGRVASTQIAAQKSLSWPGPPSPNCIPPAVWYTEGLSS